MCYVTNVDPHKRKFDVRARKGILVGFASVQKGYKVFLLDTKSVVVSRDVHFYESTFPLKNISTDSTTLPLPSADCFSEFFEDSSTYDISTNDVTASDIPSSSTELPISVPVTSDIVHVDTSSTAASDSAAVRKSTRVKKTPTWLKDYVSCASSSYTPAAFPYVAPTCFSTDYLTFLGNISQVKDPTSYEEARHYSE